MLIEPPHYQPVQTHATYTYFLYSEKVLFNPLFVDKSGYSSLIIAAGKGHTKAVEYLLSTPIVNPNASTKMGVTALSRACYSGHEDIVKLLLDAKADPNYKTNTARPLFWATCQGHKNIVEMLLKAGADHTFKYTRGQSLIYYALLHGHKDIADLLARFKKNT